MDTQTILVDLQGKLEEVLHKRENRHAKLQQAKGYKRELGDLIPKTIIKPIRAWVGTTVDKLQWKKSQQRFMQAFLDTNAEFAELKGTEAETTVLPYLLVMSDTHLVKVHVGARYASVDIFAVEPTIVPDSSDDIRKAAQEGLADLVAGKKGNFYFLTSNATGDTFDMSFNVRESLPDDISNFQFVVSLGNGALDHKRGKLERIFQLVRNGCINYGVKWLVFEETLTAHGLNLIQFLQAHQRQIEGASNAELEQKCASLEVAAKAACEGILVPVFVDGKPQDVPAWELALEYMAQTEKVVKASHLWEVSETARIRLTGQIERLSAKIAS